MGALVHGPTVSMAIPKPGPTRAREPSRVHVEPEIWGGTPRKEVKPTYEAFGEDGS